MVVTEMFDVKHTGYGIRVTVAGQLDQAEGETFVEDMRSTARKLDSGFSVFADLREMDTFPPAVGEQIAELMEFCNDQGMNRSVSVVETATTSLQMEQLVDQASIDERVIDASTTTDWESQALDWLEHGREPET
jgi:glutathionyl-hydroquinone reductase